MTRRRVILSVINDLVTDQRVHKMATTLQTAGWEVLVVGRKLPNSLPLQRTYATHRMRLCFQKGKLFYLEFQIRLFLFLIHQPKAILVANDLDTLLPNVLCKWIRKIPVVYDSHEIFTQVPELIHRPISQFIWKTLETWLIPHTNLILTVNRSLVEWFTQSYQKQAI
ncbi:MAG: glycosyltransferase, partial [Bacteroidia bacterium]|nr:glycosyltransferase [Bacteroidia bacterium]